MKARWLSMVAMSWLCVACGGGDDEQEPGPGPGSNPAAEKLNSFKKGSLASGEDAKFWAVKASAPNIYTLVTTASLISSGPDSSREADPACPVETDSGLVSRTKGGCTDKYGVEWVGEAETKISSSGGILYTYSGFGFREPVTCGGKSASRSLIYDGSLEMSSGTTQKFSVQLVMDAVTVDSATCETTTASSAVDYTGSTTGDSSDQSKPTTWNGSGRIGYADSGVISAETKDEVIHSEVCGSEALSGKTTLTTEGHKAEIQYDGATDCEATATVQWSLDGAAQGELEGIACSASSGPALAVWGLSLFGALGLMRRRARN
jgi:MYXO-CTERM domain-containing protein